MRLQAESGTVWTKLIPVSTTLEIKGMRKSVPMGALRSLVKYTDSSK